jgi:hypothetical protein
LQDNPIDVVLLGPILTGKYPHELSKELKIDFPSAHIVEIELKDEPDSIIDKIKKAVAA